MLNSFFRFLISCIVLEIFLHTMTENNGMSDILDYFFISLMLVLGDATNRVSHKKGPLGGKKTQLVNV